MGCRRLPHLSELQQVLGHSCCSANAPGNYVQHLVNLHKHIVGWGPLPHRLYHVNCCASCCERALEVVGHNVGVAVKLLSLIHISEPTRLGMISYAVFCLKKKK